LFTVVEEKSRTREQGGGRDENSHGFGMDFFGEKYSGRQGRSQNGKRPGVKPGFNRTFES